MAHGPVTVHVPHKLTLEQSQKLLGQVLGRLGCGGCLSGFDIRFVEKIDPASVVLAANKAGELEARPG